MNKHAMKWVDDAYKEKESLHVYLFATDHNIGLHNALVSLQTSQLPYTILAFGEKWQGWRQRMTFYRNAALAHAATTGNDHSVLVFMDAYDALCMKTTQEDLLSRFHSFQTPIVVGLEKNCGGNCQRLDGWFEHHASEFGAERPKNQYVNAGLIIGECMELAILYQWILDQGFKDDQLGMGHYINAFPHLFGLDFENQLFFTMSEEGPSESIPSHTPFVHIPGIHRFRLWRWRIYEQAAKQISPFCLKLHHVSNLHLTLFAILLGLLVLCCIVIFGLVRIKSRLQRQLSTVDRG
jgi:hypothetical protein